MEEKNSVKPARESTTSYSGRTQTLWLSCVVIGILLVLSASLLVASLCFSVRALPAFANEEKPECPSHMIVVPGHAIYLGGMLPKRLRGRIIGIKRKQVKDTKLEQEESYIKDNWYLYKSFQLDQIPHFVRHIERAIEIFEADKEKAVLMFSGGQTRKLAGPISEAFSYAQFALEFGYLDFQVYVEKLLLEEFARDSFENVLFSIARYFQRFGTFPRKVTFVGFPFKAKRILMHMSMFKDIISDCQYESVDITAELLKKLNKRLNTNMQLPRSDVTSPEIDRATYDSFVSDRHGCSAELLTKRLQRNPFHSIPPYYASCPLLRPYFGPCHNKHFEP